ncbi:MAG: LytTR family DNA-binding domain-containing protein [Cyclobacteriaceae bacterium]
MLRTGGLIFLVGFLVEYLMEPFQRDYNEHVYSYEIISLAHIGVAVAIYFLYFLIINPFVKEEEWTRMKELKVIFVMLFFIGVGEFFIRFIIYKPLAGIGMHQFGEEVLHAYMMGSLLFFVISTINLQWTNRHNQAMAGRFVPDDHSDWNENQERISIKAGVAGDDFDVIPSEILYVRSDGNYLEFFVKNGEVPEKLLKRLTLQSAGEQLNEFPYIVKTHRAYLVNTQHLKGVTGNAQGYQLALNGLDFKVPVSRTHIHAFNHLMNRRV